MSAPNSNIALRWFSVPLRLEPLPLAQRTGRTAQAQVQVPARTVRAGRRLRRLRRRG